jgi:hypothetical protein
MIRPTAFALTFMILTPSAAFAGDGDGPAIPKHTCDKEMVEDIYKKEYQDLIDMVDVHFVNKDTSVTDEEFCAQLEAAYNKKTEADHGPCPGGCPKDEDAVSTPPEVKRSAVTRNDMKAVVSHIDSPAINERNYTPQNTNSGGFFSNPIVGGLIGGVVGGLLGGYLANNMFGNNNQQQNPYGYPPPPPPFMPYNPYGQPPFQPPWIAGPIRPPYMMQQPNPFQYPFSGQMPPSYLGQPPPGYFGNYYGAGYGYPNYAGYQGYNPGGYMGGYYPSQGQNYYGSLPGYMTGTGYPYGTGYNPYAPPVLPMPQSAYTGVNGGR